MWSRRPDGRPADVPPYRRIMPYLMPGRNEAAVYFELEVDLTRAEPFLAAFNATHPETRATLFHLVVWAAVRTLDAYPRLNRFVAGRRIWERDGIWIAFAAKQRRLDPDAPLVVLKRRFDPAASFAETVAALHGDVAEGRAGRPRASDRELGCLLLLPDPLLRATLALGRWLDGRGLLPRSLLETDPFHGSLFVANLGSLKLDAAYHHLYEHGTTPLFCVIGRTREVPAVVEGSIAPARRASLKWTLDERIEDGLYAQGALEHLRALVEDPARNSPA